VAEDWRITVDIQDALGADGTAGRALSATSRTMHALDVAREMRNRYGGASVEPDVPDRSGLHFRLFVRLGAWLGMLGSSVRVYIGTHDEAETAAQIAREAAGQRGLAADVSIERWHPLEDRWEDAAATSRHDLAEEERISAERERISHDQQQQEERRRSAETGVAQWQVRVELRTHRDTVALAERLSAGGHSIARGWKFLVAGADAEDDAHRLAETIRMYAPADAKVHVGPEIPVVGSAYANGPVFTAQPLLREWESWDSPVSPTEPEVGAEDAESRDPDEGATG
jgi:hypothetical protein